MKLLFLRVISFKDPSIGSLTQRHVKPRGFQASAEHFVRLPELCHPDSHVKEQIEGFGGSSSVSKKIVRLLIVIFFKSSMISARSGARSIINK